MLGATIASLVLLFIANELVLSPVRHVVAMAQKVIGGDLSARVGIRPPGEMGVLCRAVDSMAHAVAEREELLKLATRQQIGRSEQLASVGRLAAGVAHEINNPLTGVLAFADMMRDKENMDEQDRQDLELIIRETKRVREIVRGLLDFARETPFVQKPMDINELIRQTLRLLGKREAFQNIYMVEDLGDNLPLVSVDRNQLQQVLLNLTLNACEAMLDGGTLMVESIGGQRPCRGHGDGHGLWHQAGAFGQDLRAVLHDQAGGERDGTGFERQLRHSAAARRHAGSGKRTRERDHVHDHLARRVGRSGWSVRRTRRRRNDVVEDPRTGQRRGNRPATISACSAPAGQDVAAVPERVRRMFRPTWSALVDVVFVILTAAELEPGRRSSASSRRLATRCRWWSSAETGGRGGRRSDAGGGRRLPPRAVFDRGIAGGSAATRTAALRPSPRSARRATTCRGTQDFEGMIGQCPAMREVFALIERIAPADATVLVTGESGTGKEMVARAIHQLSRRRDNPFLGCDCTALAPTLLESELFGHVKGSFSGAIATKKGLFEAAHQGTLLLDEVSNLSMETQGKLLRVLETRQIRKVGDTAEREVDIRLIATTNRSLAEMVKVGTFRADLYYRLNVVPITLPPFASEAATSRCWPTAFLEQFSRQMELELRGFSPEAMRQMEVYPWPGNVRELRNIVERLAVLYGGTRIELDHLPIEVREAKATVSTAELPRTWDEFKSLKRQIIDDLERRFLIAALERCSQNVTHAAESVGMQRPNFHALLRHHRLKPGTDTG